MQPTRHSREGGNPERPLGVRCEDIEELADLYVDGDLSEEATTRVARHLLRCPDCSYKVRSIEQTREHLRDAFAKQESNPGFRERMSARLQAAFADHLTPESADIPNQLSLPNLRE